VKVGVLETGPVLAAGAGGAESPEAAPGRSISGSYPQPASTIAADNASITGTGRRTAGTYGFAGAPGSGR